MNRSFLLMLSWTLVAGALAGCSADESKAAQTGTTATAEAPALPQDVQTISSVTETAAAVTETRAAANALEATGEFVSPVRSELSPKMPGRVARMYVDEGSHVRRGQPVLEVESDYVRLNLRVADAGVARAKAAMDEAGRDLNRKKDLIAKGSIPQATYDRSLAAFEQSQAAYAGATAQAALLRQQVADSTLRSPVDGIVAEKRTDVGARLGEVGDATVAFVVMQLSPLRLRFEVPERYLGRIHPGDAVSARVDPYPNETFEGRVKTIGGVIDPKTRTMFAEAEFSNRDGRLRPGLFARVSAKLD